IANLWRTRREEVEQQAEEFRRFYQRQGALRITLPEGTRAEQVTVEPELLAEAAERLLEQMDAVHGGFGAAPQFPRPLGVEFLLRVASRGQTGKTASGQQEAALDQRLMRLVRLTLDKMAEGGIYDQIGGGFHRYSTDAHWLVPHFEKMLYDNALLALLYLHAWQLTGEAGYRRICEETLDYVLREMT